MKKHEKVDWLLSSGLEYQMPTADLLKEIAIFMDNDEFDVFYERLLKMFDWVSPKEYDS